jgi:MoaA/NifB/PqqE/SkfB family radical SAM enzyme
MRRIGFELTDRCNLACTHCLREINHARRNIDTELVRRTLRSAARGGVRFVVFTGGEPTLHPAFAELAREAMRQAMHLTVVTNGQRGDPIWAAWRNAPSRRALTIALSLEAADEASFDMVRGKHAFRRFMTTVAGLQARGVPTRFNFTLGPWNEEQLEGVLALAEQLAVAGLTVALYQPTVRDELAFDPQAYRRLSAKVEAAAKQARIPVSPAYEPLTERATHLCATLGLDDLNVDHHGRVTFCCQLSSLYQSPAPGSVVVGDLGELGFAGAVGAQVSRVGAFLQRKIEDWREGAPRPNDIHPCQYCLRIFDQQQPEGGRHAA